jgi:hypothetical protein
MGYRNPWKQKFARSPEELAVEGGKNRRYLSYARVTSGFLGELGFVVL